MTLSNNELIILALVAESPTSGYSLEDRIQQRGIREWTELGLSSIYYLLKRLQDEGLAVSETSRGERHLNKRIYQATAVGQVALQEALQRRISQPRPYSTDVAIGLAFSDFLAMDIFLHALQAYQQRLLKQVVVIRQKYQAEQMAGMPPQARAVFEHSLHMMQAELNWLQAFLQKKQGINEDSK